MEPATLLPTGEVVEDGLPAGGEPTHGRDRDPRGRLQQVRRAGEPGPSALRRPSATRRAASSTAACAIASSGRPNGFGDELRAALVGEVGDVGRGSRCCARPTAITSPPADADVVGVRGAVTSPRGCGGRSCSRRSPRRGDDDEEPELASCCSPGDNSITVANPAAERWLAELRAGGRPGEHLPPVMVAVASRARSMAEGRAARVRSPAPASARWPDVGLLVRGSGARRRAPPRRRR